MFYLIFIFYSFFLFLFLIFWFPFRWIFFSRKDSFHKKRYKRRFLWKLVSSAHTDSPWEHYYINFSPPVFICLLFSSPVVFNYTAQNCIFFLEHELRSRKKKIIAIDKIKLVDNFFSAYTIVNYKRTFIRALKHQWNLCLQSGEYIKQIRSQEI